MPNKFVLQSLSPHLSVVLGHIVFERSTLLRDELSSLGIRCRHNWSMFVLQLGCLFQSFRLGRIPAAQTGTLCPDANPLMIGKC
jgi:hypothetical protein